MKVGKSIFVRSVFFPLMPVWADDVVIVVDTSGTMGEYGSWQADTVQLVKRILTGDATPAAESAQTGDTAATLHFVKAVADGVQMLRFGTVKNPVFPFFSGC